MAGLSHGSPDSLLLSPPSPGLLHSSPDSLAESWFRAKLSRQRSYGSAPPFEEPDLDLSGSLGVHALMDNMLSFISGDVGLAPAFREPEESMSTSPQAVVLAMEQQQSRAEVGPAALHTRPPSLLENALLTRSSLWLPCALLSLQLRLEALHQIVVLISGMEEKGSSERSPASFHSSSLLTSVRLQFLAGCFGLGTVGAGGLRRESVQLHHYQV